MKSAMINTLSLGISVSASALLPPPAADEWNGQGRPFTLTAHGPGSANGPIRQISDGQNRIGGGLTVTKFHIGGKGGVVDSNKRGCILTPSTQQWQCDQGVGPLHAAHIDCENTFYYHGRSEFFACPVNDDDEWNVYTKAIAAQNKCVQINLTANGNSTHWCDKPAPADKKICDEESKGKGKCVSAPEPPAAWNNTECPYRDDGRCTCKNEGGCTCDSKSRNRNKWAPSSARPATWNKTKCHYKEEEKCAPPPPRPATCNGNSHEESKHDCTISPSCPIDLNGPYEFPHLIIPLDKANGDKAGGNRFNATISPQICSAFNFDVGVSHAGKTCSLIFLLPLQKDLETSAYRFEGEGSLSFNKLARPVEHDTTYRTKGAWQHLSTNAVWPGSSTVAWTGPCEASKKVGYEVCSDDIALEYFQDWNPRPIGLYLRQC